MATAAAPQSTALASTRNRVAAILLNDEAKTQIAPFLQPGVSLERVVATINQVAIENPEILECTPESIVLAVAKGVKQDLEFGETIHLVPFNVNLARSGPPRFEKRAKALRDWKGDIELVKRSGAARDVDAQCFYENEHFVYRQGTAPYIEHHPIVDERKRGRMVGAYAWALINQRQPMKVAVLSYNEIDAIRQEHSKRWKSGPLQPWYARKTMVHQITKALPKNPKLKELEREIESDLTDIPEAEFEVVGTAAAGPDPQSADRTSGPNGKPTTDAATPAPATATDTTPALVDAEPDPAALTLEQAKALPLFGEETWWGGEAGKPLDSFTTAKLQQIRRYCVDQITQHGDEPVKQQTSNAIDLILKDRADNQATVTTGAGK